MTDGFPPLTPLDPATLTPLPPRPDFRSLVADALGGLPGLHTALDGAGTHAAENPPLDLDAVYGATVGAAAAHVDGELAGAPGSPAPRLVDAGDNTDAIRAGVAPYLPTADEPFISTFQDPPPPPDPTDPGPPLWGGPPPPVPSPPDVG